MREWGTIISKALDDFRNRNQLRPPRFIRDSSEIALLDASDGVRLLEPAPAIGVRFGFPPSERGMASTNRYLWVIDKRGVPYLIERPIPILDGRLPKHTNLTGGAQAYVGGELWFTSSESMYISGGSGRYHPASGDQLEDSVLVFESFGYEVTSLGWDEIRNQAMRAL